MDNQRKIEQKRETEKLSLTTVTTYSDDGSPQILGRILAVGEKKDKDWIAMRWNMEWKPFKRAKDAKEWLRSTGQPLQEPATDSELDRR